MTGALVGFLVGMAAMLGLGAWQVPDVRRLLQAAVPRKHDGEHLGCSRCARIRAAQSGHGTEKRAA